MAAEGIMSSNMVEAKTVDELWAKVKNRTPTCPHCGLRNPFIRSKPGHRTSTGTVMIFSCAKCKHIIACGIAEDPLENLG